MIAQTTAPFLAPHVRRPMRRALTVSQTRRGGSRADEHDPRPRPRTSCPVRSSPYKAERGRGGGTGREGERGPLWPGYEGTGGVLRVVVLDPQMVAGLRLQQELVQFPYAVRFEAQAPGTRDGTQSSELTCSLFFFQSR